MTFDGSYRRQVREAGDVFTAVIRRARCGTCQLGDALLPDLVLRRRRDSDGRDVGGGRPPTRASSGPLAWRLANLVVGGQSWRPA
jgi:hypothetical protein